MDWYGSNPEGIDRDRKFSDDDFLPLMQEEDNNDSDGEWSRATYSDASRSSSPKSIAPPSSSFLKRKAETSLDASIDQKESRKGTKRRKARAEVAVSRLRSTIMALPSNIEAIRQQGVQLALKDLINAGYNVSKLQALTTL